MGNQTIGSLLVVDDEDELRFILVQHLRTVGFEVLEARTGQEAIDTAIERQPDLIIMDVGLPGMDGVAATRALRADVRTESIPVVMLTARSQTTDVVRGLEAGAQEYVIKPFEMTELLARVQTVFRLACVRKDLDRRNTRLEAEVGLKTRRLQLLYDFMRELNRADSRDRILDLAIKCVEDMTGARRISLFVLDAVGRKLACERGVGIDPASVPRIDREDVKGITGQVFFSGKTLAARAFGSSLDGRREYNRDEFLSTPLISTSPDSHDRVMGVLNVTDRADDAPFCDEEVEFIRSIADASAIALDNVLRRGRLQQSVRVLLQTVGHLAEYRDEETTRHLERVSKMARLLAREVQREGPYAPGVSAAFINALVQAAPMHDIGKVGVPDEILAKPGKLTNEEFEVMKTHTEIGRRVLSRALDPAYSVPLLQMCIDIAYCHHERYDGTGYPRGIAGEKIPLAARIIALVDAYDAITSERRYSPAKPHEAAVRIIQSEAGEHFDPVLVDAFLRCHDKFDQVRSRHAESPALLEPAPA